jgi:hypothetical protein
MTPHSHLHFQAPRGRVPLVTLTHSKAVSFPNFCPVLFTGGFILDNKPAIKEVKGWMNRNESLRKALT